MRLALICALAALATTSLGAAAEPGAAPTAASGQKDAKAKKPRKVCRRDQPTGSTIPKRVCHTVAEPAEQAKADSPPEGAAEVARDGNAAE
jgi:hypothetical protein